MSDLQELLAKVEAATGPLDAETACHIHSLGFGVVSEFSGPYRGDCGEDEFSVFVTHNGVRRQRRVSEHDLPDRSIDAALALVERVLPHHCWQVKNTIGVQAIIWSLETDYDDRAVEWAKSSPTSSRERADVTPC